MFDCDSGQVLWSLSWMITNIEFIIFYTYLVLDIPLSLLRVLLLVKIIIRMKRMSRNSRPPTVAPTIKAVKQYTFFICIIAYITEILLIFKF